MTISRTEHELLSDLEKIMKQVDEQNARLLKISNTYERTKFQLSTVVNMLSKQLDNFEATFNCEKDIYSYEELDEYIDTAEYLEKNFGRKRNVIIHATEMRDAKLLDNARSNNLFDNFKNIKF